LYNLLDAILLDHSLSQAWARHGAMSENSNVGAHRIAQDRTAFLLDQARAIALLAKWLCRIAPAALTG